MPSQPTFTPQDFIAKWRHSSLKERSAAQEHFIDLCHLIGHSTPAEADPSGETFTFEAGATKQTGGQGWADVWKKGHFAWEYKGKHADLDKAYQQLLQYREALLNPPLLVVSDIDQIVIHTNFTNTVKQVHTLTFDDLLQPNRLALLRAVFYDPESLRAPKTTEQVTQEAAGDFARLADLLRKYDHDPQQTAHFLIRILFCLFAEDVGLLPDGLFARLVRQTRKAPAAFAAQLRQLFAAMRGGGWFGADQIAHFDGGLFDDDTAITLDSDSMDILAKVSALDWSSIEPSIFGTLFERSLDPSKRTQLGAHYTSREDILLIVEPVLMAPLRRRWEQVQAEARDLAAKLAQAKGRQRTNLHNKLSSLLTEFAAEVARVQVLDPACGSGNFLYVALRQLLDLEKEVITLAGDLGVGRFFPSVSPSQLHGIEINEYAHELAQSTIWIGYIQWLRDNGFGSPSEPILKPIETVKQMDAILAYDEQGRPIEPEWPRADVIIGNPPFLGGKKMRTELGDKYLDTLFQLYQGHVPHECDLVCYWFEKARAQISVNKAKRVGLLATNSVRGGANRRVLDHIRETGKIFWAVSDKDWILDGAAVNVSMVAFDNGSESFCILNGATVSMINADLTGTIDLGLTQRLEENKGLSFMGVTPAGPFDIPGDLAREWLKAAGNPNGRPNSDVVRPYYNGMDLTKGERDVWIIDFGTDMPLDEASLYEAPFEYVKATVYPIRSQNRRASYQEKWWLHAEARSGMRAALRPLKRYIGTSMVSKHHFFCWIPIHVLPANLIIVIARDDDYFFGVLHSRLHELWALRQGTSLEDRPRYTPTTCFETFPFPWPPGREPTDDPCVQAIAQAAHDLVQKRDAWLNPPDAPEAELKKRTLTNLYNQRPTWLDLAHRKLDEAVLDAYGWPHDLSDEDILERLLALNLERAKGNE